MTNEERFNRSKMKATVDSLVSPLLAQHQHLGLAVGLQMGKHSVVYGYGVLDEARVTVPSERTVFEIGSITKVFTATLLATMVEEGLVTLDEPLRTLLPECPDFPLEITLQHLATHTSGLPRLPANLTETPGFDLSNPYVHYTPEHLYAYLATYRRNAEGTQLGTYAYSNLGAGVLGDVLARKLGLSYEQAIVQRICHPLGLPDTRANLSAEQKERLAAPHASTGESVLNWDVPTMAGAGGLRSTARDMLTWLAANLGIVSTSLKAALSLCHEIVVEDPLSQSNLIGMALGWHVHCLPETGKALYDHNGGTGGYRTFAGFQKDSRCGVTLLSNYGFASKDIDHIGMTLLALLSSHGEARQW